MTASTRERRAGDVSRRALFAGLTGFLVAVAAVADVGDRMGWW